VRNPRKWSLPRALGYSVAIALVFIAVQSLAAILVLVVQRMASPELSVEQWLTSAESNGLVLSIAAIATVVIGVPFVKFMAGRREPEPWAFLGFKPPGLRAVLTWCAALVAFVVMSDLITIALGRPIVPPFMVDAYASAQPILLFVAVVFAAPLFEEVFFRGFMTGALESSGVPVIAAAAVSSLGWAATHVQYDLYNIATIFLMGLLLAAARVKTGSLIPCLAMHALANAIAFAEVIFFA
jgi:membrane protease YdiL (CAAX protease family)